MARSTGSVSSADLRSTVRRGATRTTRARVSGPPGHVADQADPVADDDRPRPSSRAFIAETSRSPIMHRYRPRSTAVTNPSDATVAKTFPSFRELWGQMLEQRP